MKLPEHFAKYIRDNSLFGVKDKLLLAVSGGVDSVVLCELCRQCGFGFEIAHCNFQLRGEDSDNDEKFVTRLADTYGVSLHVTRFETKKIALDRKISTQEAARELRYSWFEKIRSENECRYILTAHHADDNIETVILNFFRGTGIRGVRGIEPKHGFIIRPLLFARRQELEELIQANNLEFVIDRSNLEDVYTRNYLRNQVIPMIEKAIPGLKQNVLSNISRFREVDALYLESIKLYKKKLLEFKGREIHIPVLKLKKVEPLYSVLFEILKVYGFTAHQVTDIMALLDAESGRYVRSATHRVIRNRQWLIIAPDDPSETGLVIIDGPGTWEFAAGRVALDIMEGEPGQLSADNSEAFLDAKEIAFPLLLRKWKQGDYFYPLGMAKKKKLSRFFIDKKMSKTEKETTWVVEAGKKIIWVIGHRIDDRFKITDKTKTVLKIRSSL